MELDPIGVVPAEVPDDFMVAAMLPELTTTEDVFRLHVADQLFKRLDEQRKRENKRIAGLVKAWGTRKEMFRKELLELIAKAPGNKIATMVATTYMRSAQTDPNVDVTDESVAAQFLWLYDHDNPFQEELVDSETGDVLVQFKPHVTAAGKKKLVEVAEGRIQDKMDEAALGREAELHYDDLVPGCTYIPPRDVIVTRGRGQPLTMEQIAAIDVTDLLPRYIETAHARATMDDDDPSIVETS